MSPKSVEHIKQPMNGLILWLLRKNIVGKEEKEFKTIISKIIYKGKAQNAPIMCSSRNSSAVV